MEAVILLSGGLDSTTAMAVARDEGFELYSLSFRYGQRHDIELKAAEKVAKAMGAQEHKVLSIGLDKIGGSALTGDMKVPKPGHGNISDGRNVPVTYVPARNTIFLAYALAWAEVLGVGDIFIGVNAVDYSGYPDCRPEYISAFQNMANLATKAGVEEESVIRIRTPLINMSKAEIIRKGFELGVDYAMTHSCYDPGARGEPCGRCESCFLREKGFREAGFRDPALEI